MILPSIKERGSVVLVLLVIAALLIIAGGVFYWKFGSIASTPIKVSKQAPKEVTIGIKSAPLGFYGQKDVEYESPTFNFNANIFEGLTTFTKDLKFASRQLVESWDNPSDTTWRLRLRKGVRFHNGDEFTAEDAKYSIEFAKNYVVKDDLAQVKSVKVVDPYTIEVETNGAAPLLLNNLINAYVLNKKYTEANGFDNPVGTGPYRFIDKKGDDYHLTANDAYYLGAPAIKDVTYKVIEDDNKRVEALLSGGVQLIEDVPASRIGDIRSSKIAEFKGVPSLRVIYLGMDVKSDKTKYASTPTNPFKKLEVRQAIYRAIDESGIIEKVMGGHAYPASQPATSVNFGFNTGIVHPDYNIEEAKRLLSQAGYPNGFEVTLDVPNNRYQNDEAIGKAIVSDLAKVGIKVKLNPMPKAEYFPKILDNYDTSFYLLGWSQENGDAGGAYGTLLHTAVKDGYGGFNIGGYSNKQVDKLVEESDNTVDSVKRLNILHQLAEEAMKEVPIIPLHQQEDSFALNKDFDWTPRRDNGIRAFEISGR
jgi:peptide/nickel transport system substrate-binding protein